MSLNSINILGEGYSIGSFPQVFLLNRACYYGTWDRMRGIKDFLQGCLCFLYTRPSLIVFRYLEAFLLIRGVMTIVLNDTLFTWVLLIDSAALVKTLFLIETCILIEGLTGLNLRSVPIEICIVELNLFVLRRKRVWWWIFFAKILLLLGRHYVRTLIISLLVVYLIVRIPMSACFYLFFSCPFVHRIEDLDHIWSLWMVVSSRDDLSDFNLAAILRPI